jgi:hypothetical protein
VIEQLTHVAVKPPPIIAAGAEQVQLLSDKVKPPPQFKHAEAFEHFVQPFIPQLAHLAVHPVPTTAAG